MLPRCFVFIELSFQTNCSARLALSRILWCPFLTHIGKGRQPCWEAVFVSKNSLPARAGQKNRKAAWSATSRRLIFCCFFFHVSVISIYRTAFGSDYVCEYRSHGAVCLVLYSSPWTVVSYFLSGSNTIITNGYHNYAPLIQYMASQTMPISFQLLWEVSCCIQKFWLLSFLHMIVMCYWISINQSDWIYTVNICDPDWVDFFKCIPS